MISQFKVEQHILLQQNFSTIILGSFGLPSKTDSANCYIRYNRLVLSISNLVW